MKTSQDSLWALARFTTMTDDVKEKSSFFFFRSKNMHDVAT